MKIGRLIATTKIFKRTINSVLDEHSDTYPMLLFPSELIEVLKEYADDNRDLMRVSNIMHLITKHGSEASEYEREWNLYQYKPYYPDPDLIIYPQKRQAIKEVIDHYSYKTKEVYRPMGCAIIYVLIILLFIILSFYDKWTLYLTLTMVIPCCIGLLSISFYKKTIYIRKAKSKKVIKKEEQEAEENYQKQLAECELWNNNEWPKLVERAEQEYKEELKEYPTSLHNWKSYWRNLPKLIDSEFSFALKHLIWKKINFDVNYEEEENPRRGATEDRFLASLKNSGVTKLDRDISVNGYYPDFAIIDKYYFIDIEINEPYIFDTGKPIHFIGCGDEERNQQLQDLGAFVIRFTEDQIRHSILICSKIVTKFQEFAETGDIALLKEVLELSEQIEQKRWSYKKAIIMAEHKYREK